MDILINFINIIMHIDKYLTLIVQQYVLIAIIIISLLPGVMIFIKEKREKNENNENDIFNTDN